MHPILGNRDRLLLYMLSWLPIDLFLTYWPYGAGVLSILESVVFVLPLLVLYAFFCLSPWYLCKILPLGRTSGYKLAGNHLAAASAMGALWVLIALSWAWTLARIFPTLDSRVERFYPIYYFTGLLLYLLSVALHYLILSVEAGQNAQTLAKESELKALKMQVNPHFLFNSLNSISALTSVDAARAREMCIKLSDFLRTTLNLGDRELIPLKDELALVKNYLEVERIRFGKRLRVEHESGPECEACTVPPLIVQPLVENAIKHGISGMIEGGFVRVEARCGGGFLRVRVDNPFDPDNPSPKRNGIGLANIRQRLATKYGDAARLEAGILEDCMYRAEIRIPCGAVHRAN